MKYLLILYICSVLDGQCANTIVTNFEFNSHYDCVKEGYRQSHNQFVKLKDLENSGTLDIERDKIVIEFQCKVVPSEGV